MGVLLDIEVGWYVEVDQQGYYLLECFTWSLGRDVYSKKICSIILYTILNITPEIPSYCGKPPSMERGPIVAATTSGGTTPV